MRRPWMSWLQRNELWRRWQAGESLVDIGAALPRGPDRIDRIVEAEGGIAPPPRCRSPLALTTTEREEVSRGIARGEGVRGMARRRRRAPSTVSREIRRHGGRSLYRAERADRRACSSVSC